MLWRIVFKDEILGNYGDIEQAKYRLHVIRLCGGDGYIRRVS